MWNKIAMKIRVKKTADKEQKYQKVMIIVKIQRKKVV